MRRALVVGLVVSLAVLMPSLEKSAVGQEQPPLSIKIMRPYQQNMEPDEETGIFRIEWSDGDGPGFVRLYRDSDNEPGGEIELTSFALPARTYYSFDWDTRQIQNLTVWYIVGKISMTGEPPWDDINYSEGTVFINRKGEPFIRIDKPDADVSVDRLYTIQFSLRGIGYYWLYFDTDQQEGGEALITGPKPFVLDKFEQRAFDWETKDLPQGESYYIVGKTSKLDEGGVWSSVSYSLGKVTIDHTMQYYIKVLKPSGIEYLKTGEGYNVEWEDHDTNVQAYIYLYTDTDIDGDPSDDVNRTPIPDLLSDKTNKRQIEFNQPDDTPGKTYYVIARILDEPDGETLAEAYSKGTITLYAAEEDTTPPAAVYDLAAEPRGDGSVITLKWTAPGDDGNYGTATMYDIRRSTTPIETDDDFDAATAVEKPPFPKPSGTRQRADVEGLEPNTVYYFALKSVDDVGLWSPMSNLAWTNSMPVELSTFEAVPGLDRITLRWTTASERDALGWHIARCQESNGRFLVISDKMIPASGTTSSPHSYSFVDRKVVPGVTYYYKLLLHNFDGSVEESRVVTASLLEAPGGQGAEDRFPLILAGGFMGSTITSCEGGTLTIMAVVDPYTGSGQIARVEVYYKGIPTGILLYDDGTHGDDVAGDNIFHATVDVQPGLEPGDYVLEMVATDTEGNQSPVFPYVTVK